MSEIINVDNEVFEETGSILVVYEAQDEGNGHDVIFTAVSSNHNTSFVSGDTCCSCT
jgi:hypothetical protein